MTGTLYIMIGDELVDVLEQGAFPSLNAIMETICFYCVHDVLVVFSYAGDFSGDFESMLLGAYVTDADVVKGSEVLMLDVDVRCLSYYCAARSSVSCDLSRCSAQNLFELMQQYPQFGTSMNEVAVKRMELYEVNELWDGESAILKSRSGRTSPTSVDNATPMSTSSLQHGEGNTAVPCDERMRLCDCCTVLL